MTMEKYGTDLDSIEVTASTKAALIKLGMSVPSGLTEKQAQKMIDDFDAREKGCVDKNERI